MVIFIQSLTDEDLNMIDEFIASHRQINLAKLLKVMTLCNHRVGIPDLLRVLSSYEGKEEDVGIFEMMNGLKSLFMWNIQYDNK